MAEVQITEYTDPGCPFAFSAEPFRQRLNWLFGDQLEWRLQMVVLAETPEEYLDKGFDPARQSSAFKKLAGDYGMPIDTRERPRMAATGPACRAVVAAREHAPESERPLLRRLRVRNFSGELLDDVTTIEAAAADVGLDLAGRVHDLHRVEDAPISRDVLHPRGAVRAVEVRRIDPVPVGVMASRERLANPGRPVAEPDVAVAAAGVAELAEPPVFPRLDEGRSRRVSHRRTA